MQDDPKTEIRVVTWLAVIAEIARSRAKQPAFVNETDAMTNLMAQYLECRPANPPVFLRRALLRLAATAIRLADELYPGDGLDLEPKENNGSQT